MRDNQKGYIELLGAAALLIFVIAVVFSLFFVRFKLSNETVSGVVYNTSYNRFISDATCFSVRASEDTVVSEENRSSYCIPPNSEYQELITKAAQDKRVKVVVVAKKYFTVKAPWTVYPNVTVKEIK